MTTDRKPMCNNDILRLLADQRGRSVAEMVAHFHVARTNIHDRLRRLTAAQSVTRKLGDQRRRGRPNYLYFITTRGTAALTEDQQGPAEE